MSDQDKPGCGMVLFALVMFAIAYAMGLGMLDEMSDAPRQWWHYVVALPLGVITVNLLFLGIRVIFGR